MQAQYRSRNEAERAFRPNEHLLQIEAGIIFEQIEHRRDHAAVGQHDLQSEQLIAHHAVAQYPDAARIGRDVAADGAGAAGAEVERKIQPGVAGRLLRLLQNRAGLQGHAASRDVDRLDSVHALGRYQNIVGAGLMTADQTGHAADRNDGLARGMAKLHNPRALVG